MIVELHFDQAQMDLAEVVFKKLEVLEKRVSSSIALLDAKFFCTSYFHPTTLYSLKQTDALEGDQKR